MTELLFHASWCVAVAVSDVDSIEQAASEAFCVALDTAHICIKEAAVLMGLDEANLRKQIKREKGHHLSFFRMFRLPCAFWFAFSPALFFLIGKKRIAELTKDMNARS
jgi:hypothetical protein